MRSIESIILGGAMALGLIFSQAVQAQVDCSMAKWDGVAPTVPADAAGSPKSTRPVQRYSEYCGLEVTDALPGYVQSPVTSDGHYFGRFYVHLGASGGSSVDLLEAYSDTSGASPVFTVSFDGANLVFDAAAGGSGSAPALVNKWNLVEFEFNSGGNFNVWVNQNWDFVGQSYDTTSIAPFASGAGTVASVRLGAPNGMGGFTGKFTFDAFEAHRTTNVGALRQCDSNSDNSVGIADVVSIINELAGTLQVGQPDCNLDGSVGVSDAVFLINSL